ncbi:PaaX family transcriptional regulator C-terminal domain-containing protein [Shimia sp.]|uniref:PaaX family transcriptional regulator C-terminal domain-containing protein n=1 Tax=Shimia sp. TaxID=1954381 RepID=UPI003B8C7F66
MYKDTARSSSLAIPICGSMGRSAAGINRALPLRDVHSLFACGNTDRLSHMQHVDLQEDIDSIIGCGPIKVWSVVVTVLGDVLQAHTEWVIGPVLDQLVGRMGINNQALRVALHRLRRDGWVETQKRGRLSAHRLTAEAWAEAELVRPQIYGDPAQPTDLVTLAIGAPSIAIHDFEAEVPAGAAIFAPRCALVAGSMRSTEACLVSQFAPDRLPPWVVEALAPKILCAEYDELSAAVGRVLSHTSPDDIWARSALRLAVVHHWRRLRLRHGTVQDIVLPSDWEGARAQRLVKQALARLERPQISVLESALDSA